jgi:hypothetical protein
MYIKTLFKVPTIAVFFASLTVAMPTSAEVYSPEGIRSGPVIYYPSASLSIGTDDDLYSQGANQKSSSVTNLGAGVTMQILKGEMSGYFEVGADVSVGMYGSSSADDFQDGGISVGYIYQPSEKLLIKVSAGVNQLHDARTAATILTNNEPDRYQNNSLNGEFSYGENNSEGADSLLSYNLTSKSYSNNPATNASKESMQNEFSGLIRFPLAPNTRIRVSARYKAFDYGTENALDSTQIKALLGIEWQASDQTLLSIDIGQEQKEFDLSPVSDNSLDALEVGLVWGIEDYNRINLTVSNDFDESTTTARYLTKNKVDLAWHFDWEDYLTTVVSFGNSRDTTVNTATSAETIDTIANTAFSVEFDYSKSVKFTGSISRSDVGASAQKNIVSAGVSAAF